MGNKGRCSLHHSLSSSVYSRPSKKYKAAMISIMIMAVILKSFFICITLNPIQYLLMVKLVYHFVICNAFEVVLIVAKKFNTDGYPNTFVLKF